MAVHEIEPLLVGEPVPVVVALAALGHGIEAPGVLALGGEHRVQAGLDALGGHPGGILGHLGERHVGGDQLQPGRDHLTLQPAQAPLVRTEGHDRQVGLVAQDGGGDRLVAVTVGLLQGAQEGLAVEPGGTRQNRCRTSPTLGRS